MSQVTKSNLIAGLGMIGRPEGTHRVAAAISTAVNDTDTRVTTIEGQNLNSRVTTLETANVVKVKLTILTGSGTYNTPAGVKALWVECVGPGGGGGGALGAASALSAAGGGGSGGYAAKYFATPNTSYAYSIGTGGAAGSTTPTAGGQGSATTWDTTTIVAGAGAGGALDNSALASTRYTVDGGGGGASTAGDLLLTGHRGGPGLRLSGTNGRGGDGGGAPRFSAPKIALIATANVTGTAGNSFGGGGTGACSLNTTGVAGGAGADGVIMVWEYY